MQINKAVSEKAWQTFEVCRGGLSIPHILFARVNTKQAHLITTIIDNFCRNSGQSIRIHKSVAFTGPSVTMEMKSITNFSGIKFMENLGKYLGIPLINNRALKEKFDYIFEKMQARLTG